MLTEENIRGKGWKQIKTIIGKRFKTWKPKTEKGKQNGLVDWVDEEIDWFKKPIKIFDQEVFNMKTPIINSLKKVA